MGVLPANRAALERHHPGLLAGLHPGEPQPPAAGASPRIPHARWVVHAGLGPSYGRSLLEGWGRDDRRGLVIEPDQGRFADALATTDLSALLASPRWTWLVGLDGVALRATLERVCVDTELAFLAEALSLELGDPSSARDQRLANTVQEVMAHLLTQVGNDFDDAKLGLTNIIANREDLMARPHALEGLRNGLEGRPAIIASAGPSLQDALPLLQSVRDEIPIFCPDTSLGILLRAGIRPHLVASRERTEKCVRHFEGLDLGDIAMAAFPVLKPRILELHRGPRAYLYRSMDFSSWLERAEAPYEFDGSAGNLAFRLAMAAGCSPIVLVGQDLCFGPDGSTHAPGTATGARQEIHHRRKQSEVPGNAGGTVTTNERWLHFIRRFEVDIDGFDGTVVNTSLGGARIAGAELRALRDILPDLQRGPDPRAIVHAAFEVLPTATQQAGRRALAARLRATGTFLAELHAFLDLGLRFARQARPPDTPSGPVRLEAVIGLEPFRTLDGLRVKVIEADNALFQAFLVPLVQPVFHARERERFRLELEAGSNAELAVGLLDLQRRWFEEMLRMVVRAHALLPTSAQVPLKQIAPSSSASKLPRRPSRPKKKGNRKRKVS